MSEDGLRDQSLQPKTGSLYTALAHTITRTVALYFSRPVRLFRPSKLSGWQSLRAQAKETGQSLSPQYMVWVVRNQFNVLPKHFLPPIAVNAALGTVLWATYSEVSAILEPRFSNHQTTLAALSGGVAGAMQALAAAPVENVRLIVEGGSTKAGWSNAWQEVFRRSQQEPVQNKDLQKAREVRDWMKDVRAMAGRGWEGWGWGVAKDTCGFAVFFAVFDVTRRLAIHTTYISESAANIVSSDDGRVKSLQRHFPRTVHGATLVTGGVVAGLGYELVTRPWDMARRAIYLAHLGAPVAANTQTRLLRSFGAVQDLYQNKGLMGFIRDPSAVAAMAASSPSERLRQRAMAAARMLGRVGPWGVGFLVWEMVS